MLVGGVNPVMDGFHMLLMVSPAGCTSGIVIKVWQVQEQIHKLTAISLDTRAVLTHAQASYPAPFVP